MSLALGQRGAAVSALQQALNRRGAALSVDGRYGPATAQAVRALQQASGLVGDGIAGPATLAVLAAATAHRRLSPAALAAGAKRLAVELACVQAVAEVESAGAGFLQNGQPKILFERHIMYRQLCTLRSPGDDGQALRQRADALVRQAPNLVNPQPGGYAGGSAEQQRLSLARQLDECCANESASWGAFQIMGYHWQRLGYPSLADFVAAMACDEDQQFDAFVRFIEADPALHNALKSKQWATFAKGYNGPAYARQQYHSKLQRAYQRYAICP